MKKIFSVLILLISFFNLTAQSGKIVNKKEGATINYDNGEVVKIEGAVLQGFNKIDSLTYYFGAIGDIPALWVYNNEKLLYSYKDTFPKGKEMAITGIVTNGYGDFFAVASEAEYHLVFTGTRFHVLSRRYTWNPVVRVLVSIDVFQTTRIVNPYRDKGERMKNQKFGQEDIDIQVKKDTLIFSGKTSKRVVKSTRTFWSSDSSRTKKPVSDYGRFGIMVEIAKQDHYQKYGLNLITLDYKQFQVQRRNEETVLGKCGGDEFVQVSDSFGVHISRYRCSCPDDIDLYKIKKEGDSLYVCAAKRVYSSELGHYYYKNDDQQMGEWSDREIEEALLVWNLSGKIWKDLRVRWKQRE